MGRLDGKVALISGGARGQGACEAKLFAEEGARVVFGDVLDRDGGRVEDEIKKLGGDVKYTHLDVTSKVDWDQAADEVMESYGRLDILVNNAGITLRKSVHETTVYEWDRVQNINLKGMFLGIKTVIPLMRMSGGGSIVNISSVAGLIGSTQSAYGASKGAVRVLSKSIAVEYGREGIRCNSVHPGFVDTPMVSDMQPETRVDWMKQTPLGFFSEAKDVAYAVLYLASNESKYVTGSELVIDGGITSK